MQIDKPGGAFAISPTREIILTLLALVIVTFGATLYTIRTFFTETGYMYERIGFTLIVIALTYGVYVYLSARAGYILRTAQYVSERDDALSAFMKRAPPIVFLIPSYKEEPRTVYQTLFSAALQMYPRKRIVLLVDDPPPVTAEDHRLYAGAIDAIQSIQTEFAKQKRKLPIKATPANVGSAYNNVISWLEHLQKNLPTADHTDRHFKKWILGRAIRDLKKYKKRDAQVLERLRALLSVELSYFQRKKYVNLSHEPNKAMNVNTYIGLLGKSFKEVTKKDGLHLTRGTRMRVKDAQYLVTLDADSLLLYDYSLRLVYQMEQPAFKRTAVIQTPYSSIPQSRNTLERIAGATTDIQYIIHQGFTQYQATYWVGANAILRKSALKDIEQRDTERGFPIKRYISDRTVIEDTESTIDLVAKGWHLHNYPKRLSYSATPPDYGALLIQRRRWANGGLIILPKLVKHLTLNVLRLNYTLPAGFMRLHYLLSIAAVNVAMLFLLFYPFSDEVVDPIVFSMAITYYVIYTRDLTQLGYSKLDVLRVYALNMLLIPINLAGVLKSLEQGIRRKKIPFGRTPKIGGRTTAPWRYTFVMFAIPAIIIVIIVVDTLQGNYAHLAFNALNLVAFTYCLRLMGFRASFRELFRRV